MPMYQNSESSQSAFNFAVSYLEQIKDTLALCNMAQIQQSPTLWINYLNVLHTQLSAKTNNQEDSEIFGKFNEISKLLNDPDDRYDKKGEILGKLRLLEMKLRKMLQSKGMLLPSKDDPKFAVLKR